MAFLAFVSRWPRMALGLRMGYHNYVAEPTALPPKKDLARALLLRGSVFVHLDPRTEEVEVPEWLREQPQLVLQIGLDLPIPIPDLRVDDDGVSGTLSFQRSPHRCQVPWSAVFALVGEDGRGMVWPDDLPQEIAAEVDREARRPLSPSEVPGPAQRVPFSVLHGGATEPALKSPKLASVPNPSDSTPPAPLSAVPDPVDSSSATSSTTSSSPPRPRAGRSARRPGKRPSYLRLVK